MEWLGFVLLVVVAFVVFRLRRKPVDLSILPERFVVVDLETTGLDSSKHEIVEIGAVRVNRDSDVHDTFQAFIKTRKKIPTKITAITGITQAMIEKDGVVLEEALREFCKFAGDHRLVSFNAEFDMAFLHKAAVDSGLALNNPTSCALKMARRAWPGRKSYRLVDLAKDGGLSVAGAHRALHDCRLTITVYTSAATTLRSIS